MLVSKGDRLVNPDCTAVLASAFGARRIVHEHAGHDLTLDDPHWCTRHIADWISDAISGP